MFSSFPTLLRRPIHRSPHRPASLAFASAAVALTALTLGGGASAAHAQTVYTDVASFNAAATGNPLYTFAGWSFNVTPQAAPPSTAAPVIKSAQLDAPNGPGITVGNPRQIGVTLTGTWSTEGLQVSLNGHPGSYNSVSSSDPTVQALHLALPSFIATGVATVKIVNKYGASAQIAFVATPPLLTPGGVTAVRNADQSVTLTFSVANTTQPAGPTYKGCYAPGVMIQSARLGTATVNQYITVGNLATSLPLGKVMAGPFKLTFPASVGAKGTTVAFLISGEYGDKSYLYPSPQWGGGVSVVLP